MKSSKSDAKRSKHDDSTHCTVHGLVERTQTLEQMGVAPLHLRCDGIRMPPRMTAIKQSISAASSHVAAAAAAHKEDTNVAATQTVRGAMHRIGAGPQIA